MFHLSRIIFMAIVSASRVTPIRSPASAGPLSALLSGLIANCARSLPRALSQLGLSLARL